MVSTREFTRLKEERDALLREVEALQAKLTEYELDEPETLISDGVIDWDAHESQE